MYFLLPPIRKLMASPSSWCSAVTCWPVCPSDSAPRSKSTSATWRCCRGPTSWSAKTSEVTRQIIPPWAESACKCPLPHKTRQPPAPCPLYVGGEWVGTLWWVQLSLWEWPETERQVILPLVMAFWFSNGFRPPPTWLIVSVAKGIGGLRLEYTLKWMDTDHSARGRDGLFDQQRDVSLHSDHLQQTDVAAVMRRLGGGIVTLPPLEAVAHLWLWLICPCISFLCLSGKCKSHWWTFNTLVRLIHWRRWIVTYPVSPVRLLILSCSDFRRLSRSSASL